MRNLLLTIFLFIQFNSFGQNCFSQGITFSNQTEIDSFQINNPGCQQIDGDVSISWNGGGTIDLRPLDSILIIKGKINVRSNATSLIGLPFLTSVDGLEFIQNNLLETIRGFQKLTSIEQSLIFENNEKLNSTDAFPSLNNIEHNFVINNCNALLNLQYFPELTEIKGNLTIDRNQQLTSLSGLENLQTIGGDFTLENSDTPTPFEGLDNLKSIGGNLFISRSDLLNFSGFEKLESIGGNLELQTNSKLISFEGLENLTQLGQKLILNNNNKFEHFGGLSSLTSISDSLQIIGNNGLRKFTGFENLETIGQTFFIENNRNLESFEGLNSLTTIGGVFHIQENNNLSNFEGLDVLHTTHGLIVQNEEGLLSLNGLESLSDVNGDLKIYNNVFMTTMDGLENVEWRRDKSYLISGNSNLVVCNQASFCKLLNDWETINDLDFEISNNRLSLYCSDRAAIYFNCDECRCRPRYIFNTQSLIDSFSINFPKCKEIFYLSISEEVPFINPTINSLEGFEQLETIRGGLGISRTRNLRNLFGLKNLNQINGGISIVNNAELLSTSNLENITEVTGITVMENPKMFDLNGFQNIEKVGQFGIRIIDNPLIRTYNGLNKIKEINGYGLEIHNSAVSGAPPEMPDLHTLNGHLSIQRCNFDFNLSGFNNLELVPGEMTITAVTVTGISGFNNLKKIDGALALSGTRPPHNINGFQKLDTINGSFSLGSNGDIENFNALRYVGGDFNTRFNWDIVSYSGFENLETINGDLLIQFNPKLETFSAFKNLRNVRSLTISDNDLITDISSLSNIDPTGVNSLEIRANFDLMVCENPFVCDYLRNGGVAKIEFNAQGCNSVAEVEENCIGISSVDAESTIDVMLYPNPTSGEVNLIGDNLQMATITISDISGKVLLIETLKENQTINLPAKTKGLLYVKIETEEGVVTTRILKI